MGISPGTAVSLGTKDKPEAVICHICGLMAAAHMVLQVNDLADMKNRFDRKNRPARGPV